MENGSISIFDRISLQQVPATTGIYLFRRGRDYVYIGKSVNLRARLLSHLENAKSDRKEAAIFAQSDRIEYIIIDSEFKALLYEAEQIRTHKPQYNVRWRDDKSYLYIKVTTDEQYPKVQITRRETRTDSFYAGPFSSIKIASALVRELRKIVPFCTQPRISRQTCFYAKIGQCDPCPNMIEQLNDDVEHKRLRKVYRQHIKILIKILEGKSDKYEKQLKTTIDKLTAKELFEQAIPHRNMLLKLERLIVKKRFGDVADEINTADVQVRELKKLLTPFFPDLFPKRIECYDMSTFSFRDSTASMVVFHEGLSDKKEYKRFKIKNINANSDFDMFFEVLNRRFTHSWPAPDLIVVDGGKPQIRMVMKVFVGLGKSLPLIGIAKRPDRLIIGVTDTPLLRPPRNNPGFILVQALRDEAHRFAKKYHTTLRERKLMI